ncbi:hypothetical protein CPB83DRAFT_924174 [Crepidotus variabilis]|uniref:Uncharacterized protein n=1 Tax=Crepidotus variabilis TaxID=179855 RepID=A0A9P6JW99_9AGAR|nr:hypothetical protein CPB83DRAFT_924174 [Crepidotus variabilis]
MTSSKLEEAKSLFLLQDSLELATESLWAYIKNRSEVDDFLHKNKDEDYRREDWGEKIVLSSIWQQMAKIEKEIGLKKDLLGSSYKILFSFAEFDEENFPPILGFIRRRALYSIDWSYKFGLKIFREPGTDDYKAKELSQFESGSFGDSHNSNGWQPISYGYYDNEIGWKGDRWKREERAKYRLRSQDVHDVYEALWGPLEDLPEDAEGEVTLQYRRKLVNTVRILLAAVGLKYDIACSEGDDGFDSGPRKWMLEGLTDEWFARETRKACGVQLLGDPVNEEKGRKQRLKKSWGKIVD